MPDLGLVAACCIECRREAWFVALVGRVAVGLHGPAWVLDSDGALWAADDIDPSRSLKKDDCKPERAEFDARSIGRLRSEWGGAIVFPLSRSLEDLCDEVLVLVWLFIQDFVG
jgi:hypothetical protein